MLRTQNYMKQVNDFTPKRTESVFDTFEVLSAAGPVGAMTAEWALDYARSNGGASA